MQRARSEWQGPRRQSKAQTHNVLDPPTGKQRADRGEVRHMQNARSDWQESRRQSLVHMVYFNKYE